MVVADSSKGKSSDDILKQIQEQTSDVVAAPEKEVVEAQETQEETVAESSTEQETSEGTATEETTTETEAQTTQESPFRIKVEGRDIEIPFDKVKDYVQKGYHYEKKMADVKAREGELRRSPQIPQIPKEKLNEDFVKALQDDPFGTLMQFNQMSYQTQRNQEIEEKKADRTFEREKESSVPHWDAVKDRYHDFRDVGYDRETALLAAERDLFASLIVDSRQKGVMEGSKKEKLKQAAVIPSGAKKGTSQGAPSADEAKKMTSDQLAKALNLRITKHPDW